MYSTQARKRDHSVTALGLQSGVLYESGGEEGNVGYTWVNEK